MDKMQKKIYAVHQDYLFKPGKWNGLQTNNLDTYLKIINDHGEFLMRGPLETNGDYKQIIGQVVFQVGNKFLLHQITPSSSEERLHDLWPLLIGGHIDEEDASGNSSNLVLNAIEREFKEEVDYKGSILQKELLGLVYLEDDNLVNQFHAGLVYRFVGDSEEINPSEAQISNMRFLKIDEISQYRHKLTYWSQVVFPLLNTFIK